MKNLNPEEWFIYAKADLESAEVILNNTENYHISAYHSHQAIEKLLKRFLIINHETFPFVHDLITLIKIVNQINQKQIDLEAISFVMDIYAASRYPQGDTISKEDAVKCLNIAKSIYLTLS